MNSKTNTESIDEQILIGVRARFIYKMARPDCVLVVLSASRSYLERPSRPPVDWPRNHVGQCNRSDSRTTRSRSLSVGTTCKGVWREFSFFGEEGGRNSKFMKPPASSRSPDMRRFPSRQAINNGSGVVFLPLRLLAKYLRNFPRENSEYFKELVLIDRRKKTFFHAKHILF